ncbi:hypothetical protein LXL04_034841 [Taraxacum kok-saghyz]
MAETRRKARLICQDSPGDVLISAAFAAFNGPDIFGVGVDGEITEPMIKELDEDREESQDPELLRDDLKSNQEQLVAVLSILMHCCKIRGNRTALLKLGALSLLFEIACCTFSVEAIEPAEGILLIVESRDNINITQNALTVSNQQRNTEMVARILPYLTYGELAAMEALSFAFETSLRSFDSFDAERALRWDTWRLKSVSILPLLHALEWVAGDNEIGARAENLLDTISDKEGKGDGFLALLFPNEVYCTIQIRDQEASGLRGTNAQAILGFEKTIDEHLLDIDTKTPTPLQQQHQHSTLLGPLLLFRPLYRLIHSYRLLVAGNIISLHLSIAQVWKKSSSQSTNALAAATLLSSTVATGCFELLKGLDGEGTEPMIKELDEDREVSQDPVVKFALAWAVLECGGLEIVQKLVLVFHKITEIVLVFHIATDTIPV